MKFIDELLGHRAQWFGHLAPALRLNAPFHPLGRCATSWRLSQSGGEFGSAGERGRVGEAFHRPIMPQEVVHFLQPGPGKLLLDGTLGGGGHTRLFLEAGAEVFAMDQDSLAIEHTAPALEELYGERFTVFHGNYSSYPEILANANIVRGLDGIFLDLGVSSHQLENPARGFSFMREGPLDMRLNPEGPLMASDIVNTWGEEELEHIFSAYGDEPHSRKIARCIVRKRDERFLRTTTELADLISSVVRKTGKTHPATKVFQAIRIAVNDELGSLHRALEAAPSCLRQGGRIAILTFHSIEDRIVKNVFRRCSETTVDRPEWPAPRPNPDCFYKLILKKPLAPSEAEIQENPRARSAKLRVAERLPIKDRDKAGIV